MKIAGEWLQHTGTQALCAALEGAGFRALLVGGCVRNAVLNEAIGDIDIATDATPEQVTDIALLCDFKVIPTGLAHGTVTVLAEGRAHEVTTFRQDLETDGRRAKVAFSTRIEVDAARRDFTMNALYADRFGNIVDPLGGIDDVLSHRLRFVGNPESRITEDYLRILRFFRFYAWYGSPHNGPDPEGLAACAGLAEGLDTLSSERVSGEIKKLLSAPDPAPALAALAASGILSRVLPGADATPIARLVHLEASLPPHWIRRFAVLGGARDSRKLRFSRRDSVTIQHIQAEIASLATPAALGWKFGEALAKDIILTRSAVMGSDLPSNWQDEALRGSVAKFPVKAADFLPGLTGPALGARLKEAESRWLASDLRLSQRDLLS